MKIMKKDEYKYLILILIGTQREFLQAVEKNLMSLKEYKEFNKYIAEDKWYAKYHGPKAIFNDISIDGSTFLNFAFEWYSKTGYTNSRFIELHNQIKKKIYNKKP